ncbi:hypothetical protein [Kordia jejudonensis]|uniref:hypothetical protein n=1 Tax=Kordia jejudonensis TaxID=1348245 RepID=UPI00062966C6|nr:hypothetical protein [Kordia jejudonensis]
MKLIHKKIEQLFDGLEDKLHEVANFKVKGNKDHRNINIWTIIRSKFKNLEPIIGQNNFMKIVEDLEVNVNTKTFISYVSKNSGLDLFFTIIENDLFIFSLGEKQPARYQLFLEAVYTLEN